MKKILIHNVSGNDDTMFDPAERDGYNDPGIFLREELCRIGYSLEPSGSTSLDNCARVLFYDANSVAIYSGWKGFLRKIKARLLRKPLRRDMYAECLQKGLQDKMALFLWEASAVSPQNWKKSLHKKFPVIFTWHDAFRNNPGFVKIHWPQTRQFPPIEKVPFDKKKLLINISMNKYSSHPRELYSARRKSIRYFEEHLPDNFDLYGIGWNQRVTGAEKCFPFVYHEYKSYRGKIRNKWDVLPKYRFSLCYENIRDEPGWLTEKIFDCMRARCVPIYWGASNVTDYVDAEAFIDRRKFASDEELERYLTKITAVEYGKFQDAMEKYLASDRFAKFLPPAYADTIIGALKLDKTG